jgi:SPP1 gp7 family putative phage head morphogenesis protein
MIKKPRIARAVFPNQGVRAQYRRRMMCLIDDMAASFEYWLRAAYRKFPPRVAEAAEQAQDEAPSGRIQRTMDELARRWIARFEESAPKISEAYAKSLANHSDNSFRAALKDAGWATEFKMTPVMTDALNAAIEENIGLIKSIPRKYLDQVQGAVMRSYSVGRDLETMVKEIKAIYPKAAHKAVLIARDQSNKVNAAINRARSLDLGITEAIWLHSHAGKEPRPDHVAANGKRFKIAEGCLISGEKIMPGEKINCRCGSRVVLPF